jgi:hypothetical protein
VRRLTIRPSRRRFAARLNSGVRQGWTKILSFAGRRSPQPDRALRSSVKAAAEAYLRAATPLPRDSSRKKPRAVPASTWQNFTWRNHGHLVGHRTASHLPNKSFKPTPLRGVVINSRQSPLSLRLSLRCGAA